MITKKSARAISVAILLMLFFGSAALGEQENDYFNRGYERHLQGDLRTAVKEYSRAIDNNPRFAMAYQMRGAAWQGMKQFDKAIRDYSMVILFGESHFQAVGYYNRGIVKNMSGDFIGAIPDFTQAVTLDRKMAAAFFHRGIAKNRTGDSFGRIQDFREAARLGYIKAEEWLNTYYPSWKEHATGAPVQ
ncbi:MAG: hypothetical protein JW989_04285 [Chlorobiaceae bacterium]|nr:hypothetical protein [Chlorobiaceae bacterium]